MVRWPHGIGFDLPLPARRPRHPLRCLVGDSLAAERATAGRGGLRLRGDRPSARRGHRTRPARDDVRDTAGRCGSHWPRPARAPRRHRARPRPRLRRGNHAERQLGRPGPRGSGRGPLPARRVPFRGRRAGRRRAFLHRHGRVSRSHRGAGSNAGDRRGRWRLRRPAGSVPCARLRARPGGSGAAVSLQADLGRLRRRREARRRARHRRPHCPPLPRRWLHADHDRRRRGRHHPRRRRRTRHGPRRRCRTWHGPRLSSHGPAAAPAPPDRGGRDGRRAGEFPARRSAPPVGPAGRPRRSAPPVGPAGRPRRSAPPVGPAGRPRRSAPPVSPPVSAARRCRGHPGGPLRPCRRRAWSGSRVRRAPGPGSARPPVWSAPRPSPAGRP